MVAVKILFCFALSTLLFVLCSFTEAQQKSERIARIVFISPSSPLTAAVNIEAFEQGLRELGYIEGKNVVIDFRWAEGSTQRLANLVAEAMRSKLDVLVIGGASGAIAAKKSRSEEHTSELQSR